MKRLLRERYERYEIGNPYETKYHPADQAIKQLLFRVVNQESADLVNKKFT